jgi:hypothetical protein
MGDAFPFRRPPRALPVSSLLFFFLVGQEFLAHADANRRFDDNGRSLGGDGSSLC